MIFIFQVLVAIFCLTFLSIGIVAEVAPSAFFNEECASPKSNQYLQTAFAAYNESNLKFCQGSCPCRFENDASINNPEYSEP